MGMRPLPVAECDDCKSRVETADAGTDVTGSGGGEGRVSSTFETRVIASFATTENELGRGDNMEGDDMDRSTAGRRTFGGWVARLLGGSVEDVPIVGVSGGLSGAFSIDSRKRSSEDGRWKAGRGNESDETVSDKRECRGTGTHTIEVRIDEVSFHVRQLIFYSGLSGYRSSTMTRSR